MKTKYIITAITTALMLTTAAIAQSEGAYDLGGISADGDALTSLLDPSRFSISHSMSFMAGGSQISNVQSQSMYSTMMRYKFNAPVVLSLNFDMPIHSTFNPYNNFNTDNLQSFDYFRNMPIDASIAWMPSDRFMFRFSVIRMPEATAFYNGGYGHRFSRF